MTAALLLQVWKHQLLQTHNKSEMRSSEKKNCILTAAGDRSRGYRRQEAGEETKVIHRREDGEADAGDRAGTGCEVRTGHRAGAGGEVQEAGAGGEVLSADWNVRGPSTLYSEGCHCFGIYAHSAVCSTQCRVWTVHCALFTVHCVLCTVHCTQCTVNCAFVQCRVQ